MIAFGKKKPVFTDYSGIQDALSEALTKLGIKVKNNSDYAIDKVVPTLWDRINKLSEPNDTISRISAITEYVLISWKILEKF